MDNKRFDSLTKALASGQSRRSVIKGLLGLGGAAAVSTVVADGTDARRRSNITLPAAPTTTTAAPCRAGFEPCTTNVTGCCAICSGNTPVTCGLECCASDDQCCDGECCGGDQLCVAKVLDCSNSRCEEICCDEDQICDGRCCNGTCFQPIDELFGDDDDDDDDGGFDRACCPKSATFCPFMYDDRFGVCCDGDTPVCCQDENGYPICIREDQCCTASDCPELEGQGEEACWNCRENTCVPVPRGDQGGCDDCFGCSGTQECDPNPTVNGETCGGGFGDDDDGGGVCCGGVCCGGLEPACCTRDDVSFCIDEATQCCLNRDCDDSPKTCEKGICRKSDQTCILRTECEDNETCCVNAPEPVCVDVTQQDVCCTSDDCDNGCLACEATVCVAQCDRDTCCTADEDRANWFCLAEDECCPLDCGGNACCDGVCCDAGQICVSPVDVSSDEVSVAVDGGSVCCTPLTCEDESIGGLGEPCGRALDNGCGGITACGCKEGVCDTTQGICVQPTTTTPEPTTTTPEPICPGQVQCSGANANCCATEGQCAPNGDCCATDRIICGDVCCQGPCDTCVDGQCVSNLDDASACSDPRNSYASGICCNGACNSSGATTCAPPTTTQPPCVPNCDCSDPNNAGLTCNGYDPGVAICFNGWCVFSADICGENVCGGNDECETCIEGECVLINQGGSCNGGAGICQDEWCV